MNQQTLITYAVSFAVIAVVLAIRWKRMSRVRPLKVERLWVFPALYGLLAAYMYVTHPPAGWAWAFCAGALGLGGLLGWQRGRMMRITVDPETHQLNQSASPAAVLFIVALIVARSGARAVMAATGVDPAAMNTVAITDILIAFGLGLFALQRLEMYLRATRMLAAAPPRPG